MPAVAGVFRVRSGECTPEERVAEEGRRNALQRIALVENRAYGGARLRVRATGNALRRSALRRSAFAEEDD